MQQLKFITKAAYAKSRGLNRSTVSRQIQQGKIPTVNGLVDPAAADRARQANLSPARRLDAERRKQEAGPAAPGQRAGADKEAYRFFFERGQKSAARALCTSVRTSLLPILVGMPLPGVKSEEGEFRARVGLVALIDWLVRGWCEELLPAGESLLAVDFRKHLGRAAKPAKAWFEALQAYWRANSEDEAASMWPAAFAAEWPPDGYVPMPEMRTGAKPKRGKA